MPRTRTLRCHCAVQSQAAAPKRWFPEVKYLSGAILILTLLESFHRKRQNAHRWKRGCIFCAKEEHFQALRQYFKGRRDMMHDHSQHRIGHWQPLLEQRSQEGLKRSGIRKNLIKPSHNVASRIKANQNMRRTRWSAPCTSLGGSLISSTDRILLILSLLCSMITAWSKCIIFELELTVSHPQITSDKPK